MSQPSIQSERAQLAATIGARENAEAFFQPRVALGDLDLCGKLILQHLDFLAGTNTMTVDFRGVPDDRVAEWASRIYANTLAHLCEKNAEVRSAYLRHGSYVPADETARLLFMRQAYTNFSFFMWLLASPTQPADPKNLCSLRFVVLQDTILLEDINAIRNGQPGGWGWLEKSIKGLRDVAKGFEIRRIKAVATNERVYRAFLKRGFVDQTSVDGFSRYVEKYAKPIELTFA